MKEISLTRGLVTQVDDEDYNWLNKWKWFAMAGYKNTYYAARNDHGNIIFMHKLILGLSKSIQGDHADTNKLNNQRYNLRPSTHSMNCVNVIHKNSSGYRGVSYNKNLKKYHVQLSVSGRKRNFGYFDDPILAAKKYDCMAKKYHGEFAILNFK